MNLTLTRKQFRKDGIFGELFDQHGDYMCVTLEHSYALFPDSDEAYSAKIPMGEYICVRGIHRLEKMTADFVTFEVMDVPGHTNILFHVGNYNDDSHGCILLGKQLGNMISGGKMLMSSNQAFAQFLTEVEGLDSFTLKVE